MTTALLSLALTPITLRDARQFIAEHHRHNQPPHGWKFGTSLTDSTGETRGVAVAGRPIARAQDDGLTIEITRVCSLGDRNANSQLYAAILRAAKALGYRRAITYTLKDESDASLRAVGFEFDGWTVSSSWNTPRRLRLTENLFGEQLKPGGSKKRWTKCL